MIARSQDVSSAPRSNNDESVGLTNSDSSLFHDARASVSACQHNGHEGCLSQPPIPAISNLQRQGMHQQDHNLNEEHRTRHHKKKHKKKHGKGEDKRYVSSKDTDKCDDDGESPHQWPWLTESEHVHHIVQGMQRTEAHPREAQPAKKRNEGIILENLSGVLPRNSEKIEVPCTWPWLTESEGAVQQIREGYAGGADVTKAKGAGLSFTTKEKISLHYELHTEEPPDLAFNAAETIQSRDGNESQQLDTHQMSHQPGAFAVDGPMMSAGQAEHYVDIENQQREQEEVFEEVPVPLICATLVDANGDGTASTLTPASNSLISAKAKAVNPLRTFILVATLIVVVIVVIVVSMALTLGNNQDNIEGDNTDEAVVQIPILPGSWQQIGSSLQGDGTLYFFGGSTSLSFDGSILAVGIPGFGMLGGMVRVYKNVGEDWTQVGSDLVGTPSDLFGWNVDISSDGTVLAVGAVQAVPQSGQPGYARVYRLVNGTTWMQLGETFEGDHSQASFGSSVSLSSDGLTVAIGGPFHGRNGLVQSGYAKIFQYLITTGEWKQVGQTLYGYETGDEFGIHVSISSNGSVLAVGSNQFRAKTLKPGFVQVFHFDESAQQWTQRGADIIGEFAGEEFGWSTVISADGNMLASGAPKSDGTAGEDVGSVRVFRYDQDQGDWLQVGSNIKGREPQDFFGNWVDLSSNGTILVTGAWQSELEKSDPGYMRVFQLVNDTWFQVGDDILQSHDGESIFNEFGINVCVSGDGSTIAMGTLYFDREDEPDVGQVQVYSL